MKQTGTELKVGVFTILSGAVIIYMFFVLSPESFRNDEYQNFHTIIKDAAGIVEKTHVKTNGVVVGRVKEVKLESNRTRIDLELEKGIKIPVGSRIAIKEKGLLGDVFIQIDRSDDEGVYIEDGGFIPPATNQVSLTALVEVAGSIGNDVKKVTGTLAKVLGGAKGEKDLTEVINDIKTLVKEARLIAEENRQGIKSIVDNIEKTTQSLKLAIGDKGQDLVYIVDNIKETSEEFKSFSKDIRGIVSKDNREKIDRIIGSFDNTMQDVEVTAKNVRLVADKLESGEGTLGKLINNDKALVELEAAIKEVREVISPANKLKLAIEYHGEFRRDESTQHYFNGIFRLRPDRFYLLGFTDKSETLRETTYEKIPVRNEGDDSIADADHPRAVRERIYQQNAIRFNIQFGKRWDQLQMRFGLFESTGGLAADYYLLGDKLRLTLEAFEWDSQSQIRKTAHIKGYLRILFFKHIYAYVGIDDPTRIDPENGTVMKDLNYFIGAGIGFNDEDFKSLFGTAALAL